MDNNEEKISEQLNKFQDLANKDLAIDLASLALDELNKPQNLVSPTVKRWAYALSVLFPPFGLLIALYFFLRGEEDSNAVAWICIVLTALTLLLFWLFVSLMMSGTGVSVEEVQQIDPEEIRELLQ